MKNFLRLLNYARPWRRFWPGYIILAVLSVIFGIVNYSLISPVLRLLFESPTNEQVSAEISALADKTREFSMSMDWFEDTFQYYMDKIFLANGPLKALLFVCALLVGASLLSNITRYLSQTILVRMRTHIMKKLRTDLFRKVSTMDVGFYHTQQKGDIISRISNDVTEVQNGVADSFHMIFREPLLIIGFISYCFYLSPKLTLVTLVTIPLSGLAIGALSKRLRKKAIETQSLMGRIVSHFDEAISGIRIIKGFNAQKYVQENFEQTNEAHKKSSRKMLYRQQLAHPTSEFLGITIAAAVLLYGGWLQINGSLGLSMGTFTVYILCYWRVLEPAKNIAKAYASIQRGLVSGERLFVILDAENQIKEKDDAKTLKEFKSGIEYRGVNFSYNEDVPVLKDVSVCIPKGKMVALVGPSGAGKSTFADLLPRFYDVTGGGIFIDGVDIRDYTLDSLTAQMGIVTQESILFNDTVYNNITFGMEHVSEKQVVEAARIANALEFIKQLPHGFQTNIGDRGENLSGGQRQRIAIARAVLKNPPILILDEATSALDTESERLVQDALYKLMQNRTSIVIAHRLSTIRYADDIVVMKDGRIVEEGNHDALMEKNGIYAGLCAMQVFS
ncbi:MAG: ABC transporter ATP-binding protein [Bacteroidales bacterium]|nr:ABC transporter ATP-binding protein [Bacteroidales bacterium]MBQ2492924.1 ABC transporter ATP-binding protein [Bacteroidales bacterium]MBQ4196702.1 ABC transporter ATP-binding protein [Bacteroidales bacterium]